MFDVKNVVEEINSCFENKDVEARVTDGGGKFIGRGTNLVYQKPA